MQIQAQAHDPGRLAPMAKGTPRALYLKRKVQWETSPIKAVPEEKGCSALEDIRRTKRKQVKGAALGFYSSWADEPGPHPWLCLATHSEIESIGQTCLTSTS